MSNSIRQVRMGDLYIFKQCNSKMISWYVEHCEDITEISEFLQVDEDDVFADILDKGLKEMQNIMEMLKDAKRGDEI